MVQSEMHLRDRTDQTHDGLDDGVGSFDQILRRFKCPASDFMFVSNDGGCWSGLSFVRGKD